MKKVFSIVLMMVAIVVPSTIHAQGSLKIGHVNSAEIIELLPATDTVNAQLQKEAEELQKELENMQAAYNTTLETFQANSESWSKLVKDTKQSEIVDMQSRIQRFSQNANTEVQNRNRELFQPIYDMVQKAINDVANDQKLTYVLDTGSGAVLFSSESSLDIKVLVLEKLGVKQ